MGFRTPAGQLTTTQSFKTIELPRIVRGKPGAWDPLVCLDWGHQFLTFLKGVVRSHDSARDTIWRVKFSPRTEASVEVLDRAGVEFVVNSEDRVGFLPRWYWEELQGEAGNDPHTYQSGEAQPKRDASLAATAGWQI